MSQPKFPKLSGPQRLMLAFSAANLIVGVVRLALVLFT